ncbi:MAG TPA: response regulator [Terriglobales bacterium]|nr:response regulator [Terriglobales bacterium]
MKILLADDSVTAQNMGKKILSEAGHEVLCVSNGAAALKKVAEQEPDLVILDIYMPGYSGLEVCQRLKEGPETAAVPVVLTVGKLEPFRKEDAQRVRAEALIIKPFEATELAAAVARFAETAAANPSKAKSKGKLGPQPKAKPRWEDTPEYEFVTTTQKLEEEEEKTAAPNSSAKTVAQGATEMPAGAAEPPSRSGASEFEVAAATEKAEAPGIASWQTESVAATSSEAETGAAESSWQPGPAEFNVQAEAASPAGEQPAIAKAAAAGAGADFDSAARAEFSSGEPLATDFSITAPSDSPSAEANAFTAQFASDVPGVPELPAAPPDFSATAAEPMAVPATDPAFDPDRTQWATQFATHFGVAEEEPAAPAEPDAPPAPESSAVEAEPAAAPADDIAAILSNLPGGMASPQAPRPNEESAQLGQRPWPTEVPGPDGEGLKAEEVPVEDRDSSVSLAEEMEKASAASFEDRAQPDLTASETPADREEMDSAAAFERQQENQPVPEAAAAAQSEESAASLNQGEAGFGAPPAPEAKPAQPAPDQVAGVMQSAAMAIATRATVSAVASQLHTQPAENVSTGPTAIENLVAQVLERLKPKLIAEIKRELGTPEEK